MFCIKCGKEVKEGTKFCTNCGAELTPAPKEEKKNEKKEEKLTYSQNKAIETTSNPTPVAVEHKETTSDGKATASLVLGIVSFVVPCVGFITSIIGLILGICSKKSGKKIAGIILNSIALGLIVIGWIVIYSLGIFAGAVEESQTTQNYTTPSYTTPSYKKPTTTKPQTGVTTSTGTLVFDVYEITLSNKYEIIKDEKEYSLHNGEDVIKLPVTIKNTSDTRSHLNMYYHEYYAPNGDKIDSVRSDFGSAADAIDYVWLDPNETKIQYFYILYKGDGKYKIEFDNHKEEKTIEFTIKK